ncbi:exopolysaccharide Pel transporter PelG [Pendulispora brunnea]|uniref:Exopolysaccharide Pel transporter PelG n=1 Tax=Pendulispora brunnea TaxID=2905690 RepID=A0ABZ2KGK9_9BACT
MAGIGFELRQHLQKESYTDLFRAYLVAGVVGSGPWLISICSLLLINFWGHAYSRDPEAITQFSATVTHLMATSLVVSGLVQLLFTRYVADRIFQKNADAIVPNLFGVLLLTVIGTGTLGSLVSLLLFPEGGHLAFRALLVTGFVLLCNTWVLTVLFSGMKAYRSVVVIFLGGYTVTVGASLALASYGAGGYLAGFCLGHGLMFFCMLVMVLRQYPSQRFIAFDFLNKKRVFPELALTGCLFNAAIWADKFIFWWNPVTSEPLIGPIRYSVVYDIPIFVAYLSIIPGMAVFFVRIETDFAESYELYYTAVRQGETLNELRRLRNGLVEAARAGIYDIFRIQGLAVAVLLLIGSKVLNLFRIPPFYLYLFRIDVVGVGFQVVLLGLFTILFYLDYRKLVLYMCAFFLVANVVLSLVSLHLGPRFYGFGFAVAVALTSVLTLGLLSRKLDRLDYETFMR